MPIYEYRCEKCGQVNEFLILGKGEQLLCKQCGSKDMSCCVMKKGAGPTPGMEEHKGHQH